MERLKWLTDWQEASKHPIRATLSLFGLGAIGGGVIAYFRFTNGSVVGAAVVGVLTGFVLVLVGSRYVRDPEKASQPPPLTYVFPALSASIGLILLVVGIAAGSRDVLLSGSLFLALSLVLVVAKRITSGSS